MPKRARRARSCLGSQLRRERARERATRTERADGSGGRESVSGSPRGESPSDKKGRGDDDSRTAVRDGVHRTRGRRRNNLARAAAGGRRSRRVAVRLSMSNPSAKLYNNAKQKLLDGKQIFHVTISRLDVKLYCEERSTTTAYSFEIQHSTMSSRDVKKMNRSVTTSTSNTDHPHPRRVPEQRSRRPPTSCARYGVAPTNRVGLAVGERRSRRHASRSPREQGRRGMGAGQATAICRHEQHQLPRHVQRRRVRHRPVRNTAQHHQRLRHRHRSRRRRTARVGTAT